MKALRIIHLISILVFIISLFLPYMSGLTIEKLNETSVIFEFANDYYETTFYGYEIIFGKINLIIIILIFLVFLLSKKPSNIYFLIPIGIVYMICQLFALLTTMAGFGAPHGNNLLIGFTLMYICTIALFLTTIIKFVILKNIKAQHSLDNL
jgi:hypothetical protein